MRSLQGARGRFWGKSGPDTPERRNNFDLLRLLAASQVVYLHAVLFLELDGRGVMAALNYLAAVFPGVPIFFVVSGFLISQSYENCPDLRRFLRKRALRIYPGLYVCLAVTLLLLASLGLVQAFTSADFGFREAILEGWSFPVWLIGQLTVGQFLDAPGVQFFGVGKLNPSLWTIPIEIGFYLLVPVLYRLVITRFRQRAATAVLLGIAGVSFLTWFFGIFTRLGVHAGNDTLWVNLLVGDGPRPIQFLRQSPLPHLYWFVIGILIWRHIGVIGRLVRHRVLRWTVAYLTLACVPILLDAQWIRTAMWYQLARTVGLAMWAISFALSPRGGSHRLLGGLDLSFGLYLFHMLVINLLVELNIIHNLLLLPLVFAVSLALALASWKLVEAPALRRKDLPPRKPRQLGDPQQRE